MSDMTELSPLTATWRVYPKKTTLGYDVVAARPSTSLPEGWSDTAFICTTSDLETAELICRLRNETDLIV